MNGFQLLSEIYRLLGQIDDSTASDVLKMEIPADIRPIIEGMLKVSGSEQLTCKSLVSSGVKVAEKSSLENPPRVIGNGQKEIGVSEVIQACKRLSIGQFISVLQNAGIPIASGFKGGRKALDERVAREFGKLQEKRRKTVFEGILRSLGSGETEGWFKAIRETSKD